MKRVLQILAAIVTLCVAVAVVLVVVHVVEQRTQKAYKPVLYLYPEQERTMTVTLDLKGTLDTVYPAPERVTSVDGRTRASWTVGAARDGTLTDTSGRTYPSIFWDATMALPEPDAGFVVSRDDAVAFLEDKLAQLGLNEREAADFITYWAPRMRAHDYTFVSFDASAYTRRAAYSFADAAGEAVTPDTFIRVFMSIREADASTVAEPQILTPPPPRSGLPRSNGAEPSDRGGWRERAKMRHSRHNGTKCGEMKAPRTGR